MAEEEEEEEEEEETSTSLRKWEEGVLEGSVELKKKERCRGEEGASSLKKKGEGRGGKMNKK